MTSNEGTHYHDGDSWIRKGFHRDCHGVIIQDEFEGQWEIDAKKEEP